MALKKTALKLIFAALAFYGVERFCHWQTEGFSISRISSGKTAIATWTPPLLNDAEKQDLARILDQPFTYLGKGAQSFVFASGDGRYVLKLLREERLRPSPLAFKESQRHKKANKRRRIIESCQLAFEKMQEETGLLYIHLNSAAPPLGHTTIVDKLGIPHILDLSRCEFILQKRADMVYPTLENWVKEGRLDEAKEALDQLIALIQLRQSRGIFDKDPDFKSNFGFTSQGAIQIDFGRFRKDPLQNGGLRTITQQLRRDLRALSPALADFLERRVCEEEKKCAF